MRWSGWVLLPLVAACAHHPAPAVAPTSVPAAAARNDIHWFRSSAEYRAIAREVYRDAAEHLPGMIASLQRGQWGVILDIDETVLDNSLQERRDADAHREFSEIGWSAWVHQAAATAIPGAVDFIHTVQHLGGRVALVTNRADSLCAATRENLKRIGVLPDELLCATGSTDKNPRFQQVQDGSADRSIGPLRIVEWIGDNIEDFPGMHQSMREALESYRDFGLRYFVLPNPMYGSWRGNTEP